jgi:hypothetical protein
LCWVKRWKSVGTAEGGTSRWLSWTSIAIIIIIIIIIFNGVWRRFPALLAWWRRNDFAHPSRQRARKERDRHTHTGKRERKRENWSELIAQKDRHTVVAGW